MREKLPQLEQALTRRVTAHHRFLVARQLAHIDSLDALIAEVSAEITARLHAADAAAVPTERRGSGIPEDPPTRPFTDALERLDTIPGVGQRTAEILLAELGLDLARLPTAGHLASWAGMCPGNHESAGKRQTGRTRKGIPRPAGRLGRGGASGRAQ